VHATREKYGENEIQQFMMRLSRSLRRIPLGVFTGWLLAWCGDLSGDDTVGHLTGGGFEVAGSQFRCRSTINSKRQYNDHGSLGWSRPRARTPSYSDINEADRATETHRRRGPGVSEVPNPTQRPRTDRSYVVSLALDSRNTTDVAKKLRQKVGIHGDQSGQTGNGHVRLYVIGQGALSAAAAANTKHDIADAEKWTCRSS